MKKTLILYYSRTGRTESIAQILKKRLNADMIEITDDMNRKGFLGLLRCMGEAIKESIPEIYPKELPLDEYQLVLLGSPVWGGSLSTPMLKLYQDHKSELVNT
ncbi:MAG: hypothetical protein GF364_03075, partial [Candidatus Lokiarchaeota archaeon]|nr:hypothetical protein [Candidatus Lokiarchaeota archaeon]